MLRLLLSLLLSLGIGLTVIGFAASADAATLTVDSDKPTYLVGETITLTVTGDDQDALSYGIFGRLDYSGALVDNGTRTQIVLVGNTGTWLQGSLDQGDDGNQAFSFAFNYIPHTGFTPDTVNNLPADNPFATVTLIATAVGLVDVSWHIVVDQTQQDFNFFGIFPAPPGTSFLIVPEPTTATLLILGLLGLAGWRKLVGL